MEPRIELLNDKKLVGIKLKMSLTNNKTGQLWASFGPKIKYIKKDSESSSQREKNTLILVKLNLINIIKK